MIKFKLSTYREGKDFKGSYFFILNKGNNSGKPMLTPCPNCFVCLCENDQDKEELYWLLFGMWQGKAIHPHLISSVIPFIRLRELCDLIKIGLEKLTINPEKVRKNISIIVQMEKHQDNIQKQLDLIKQMKRALIFEVLK
jgi:hypothetical protein